MECFDYCKLALCTELLGNPGLECQACDESYACRPGTVGFDKPEVLRANVPSLASEDAVAATPNIPALESENAVAATPNIPALESENAVAATPNIPPLVPQDAAAASTRSDENLHDTDDVEDGDDEEAAADAPPPMCGLLGAAYAMDHDVLCVRLSHNVPWLGKLRLHNESASSGSLHGHLPRVISSGRAAWWQVRDGVFWTDTGGGKPAARLEPYTMTVWYRARCLRDCGAAAAQTAEAFLVGVTVSLRSLGRMDGRLEGEHSVTVRVASPGGAEAASRHHTLVANATWTPCVIEATVTLSSGPPDNPAAAAAAAPPAAASSHVHVRERSVVRPVHPEDSKASWCNTAKTAEVASTRFSNDHLRDGNGAVDMAHAAPVCMEMAMSKAVNTVHIRYFLAQQKAEAELLNATEFHLCEGSPDANNVMQPVDGMTYQKRLHEYLAPYRMATRLHIHMAFYAKSVCAANGALDRQRAMAAVQGDADVAALPTYAPGYFTLRRTPDDYLRERNMTAADVMGHEDAPGWDSWLHLLSPYSHEANATATDGAAKWTRAIARNVDPIFLPEQPDPDADFCPLPILHHEPYNTWESWHVWNVTSHLMQAGSAFCAIDADERRGRFARWRQTLEDVAHRHRSNNAFIVYWKTYDQPCKLRPSMDSMGDWSVESIQADSERRMVEFLEEMRQKGDCDLAGVTAPDLVSAWANDTQITLSMAKGLLSYRMPAIGTKCACSALGPTRVRQLQAVIGPLPADERFRRGETFFTSWGTWAVTLATAYHKITPICEPADPLYARFDTTTNWACTDQPLPTEPDGKIVYDLIPGHPLHGHCVGSGCVRAAKAIDEYRAYMHEFSGFRTRVIHSMLGYQCPFDDGSPFLGQLTRLRDWLPRVVAGLKAAQPDLIPTCVSPTRTNPNVAAENFERSIDLKKLILFESTNHDDQSSSSVEDDALQIDIAVPPANWTRAAPDNQDSAPSSNGAAANVPFDGPFGDSTHTPSSVAPQSTPGPPGTVIMPPGDVARCTGGCNGSIGSIRSIGSMGSAAVGGMSTTTLMLTLVVCAPLLGALVFICGVHCLRKRRRRQRQASYWLDPAGDDDGEPSLDEGVDDAATRPPEEMSQAEAEREAMCALAASLHSTAKEEAERAAMSALAESLHAAA